MNTMLPTMHVLFYMFLMCHKKTNVMRNPKKLESSLPNYYGVLTTVLLYTNKAYPIH